MTARIEGFTHHCVVQSGPAAGNKVRREVKAHEYEYAETCQHCGEPLVTTRQLLAHIYDQLTS